MIMMDAKMTTWIMIKYYEGIVSRKIKRVKKRVL